MASGAWLPILTAPCRGNFEPRRLRKTYRRRYASRRRVTRLVEAPLLLLWEAYGIVGLFDVEASWHSKAMDGRDRELPCGHSTQEEPPEVLLTELAAFFPKA